MKLVNGEPAKARPEDYQQVFEQNPQGALILEELVARFGGNPYVRGGIEAQRETDFRAGCLRVVSHILDQINRANGAEVSDDAEG
jgi:hypothetical protein